MRAILPFVLSLSLVQSALAQTSAPEPTAPVPVLTAPPSAAGSTATPAALDTPQPAAIAPAEPGTVTPAGGDTSAAAAAATAIPGEESFTLPDAAGDASGLLSAAELEGLGFGAGEETVDMDLRVSGFMDFSLWMGLMPKESGWRQYYARYPTFFVGNFNIYLEKNLSRSVRTMGEFRLTYLPNGALAPGAEDYVSNVTQDYADYFRPAKWGGVLIERVYIEWTIVPFLTARFGQFLTPYGVWNVDHGSPTLISVRRPFVIGSEMFPQRQTGVELFGRADLGTESVLGYHLTLSNGDGPIKEYRDLDANKAVGGRLYLEHRGLGLLRIGGSAYYGRDSNTIRTIALGPDGKLIYGERVRAQSDLLSFAADVVWKYQGIHVQGEFIYKQRAYTKEGRVLGVHPVTRQSLFPADHNGWGMYLLAGYRFEWLGVMPYVMFQNFKDVDTSNIMGRVIGFRGGVNVRPLDALVVKVELDYSTFPDGNIVEDDDLRTLELQIAWAF